MSKRLCIECNKPIPATDFRCSKCASFAIMNPTKRNLPLSGQTMWKNGNGNYVPKPSA